MDKEQRYSYDAYGASGGTLKRQPKPPPRERRCCGCLARSRTRAFLAGLATNLGICVLLAGYTLIGSVIFLAIEGGGVYQSGNPLATVSIEHQQVSYNQTSGTPLTAQTQTRTAVARARAVENIWDITVSLNILYRDNWTRLAAQEITRFQEEVARAVADEWRRREAAQDVQEDQQPGPERGEYEWTFARAFLYSLTVLTTIGYGNIAPRTSLGKAVTMGYAMLGIPLTLLYLSSVGSILSRVARGVFSRALCCCLCSNCGYCCYDERRMQEKERKMRRKRQQMELQQQLGLQEPFYVRSTTTSFPPPATGTLRSPDSKAELDSLGSCTESRTSSMHGWTILAPVSLCLAMMFIYICMGTVALYKMEGWHPLDGFYFCFMGLTTIGFGDVGFNGGTPLQGADTTIWFCSVYIMSGMALTAMCFNVVHDEIVHRLRHHHLNHQQDSPRRHSKQPPTAAGGYLENGADGDPFCS